ncbi:MAG: DoxX family protein [Rhizobiales bacterium]|nr:DoxX family protein [Hyphomicrobiales bacterium]MBI3673839.1 DoxX family protein [Hyphomicrobiales bacterium]
MSRLKDAIDLAGRVLIAALFIWDGWGITQDYGGAADYLTQHGVPGFALPMALALQLGGGALVIVGWWTRLAALGLAGFCLSTALIFHSDFSDFNEQIHFWKDLAIAGGFLILAAHGAGGWALDARGRQAGI